MSTPTNKGAAKIEMFELVNRLKKKLGMQGARESDEGFIDPAAIEETDRMIEKMCEECPDTMAVHLEEIIKIWAEMKDMPRCPQRDELGQEVFTLAHEIKDLGAMCGHDLAAYFAESLRDYIIRTELKLEAQRVITQAHIDALQVVIKKGLKDEEGAAAAELKEMVKIAIDRFS